MSQLPEQHTPSSNDQHLKRNSQSVGGIDDPEIGLASLTSGLVAPTDRRPSSPPESPRHGGNNDDAGSRFSNDSERGGSGGKDSSGQKNLTKVSRLRKIAYGSLLLSQLILCILIIVELTTFKGFLHRSAEQSAMLKLGLLEFQYEHMFFRMRKGMGGLSTMTEVINYLKAPSDANKAAIVGPLIQVNAQFRKQEILTLVSQNCTILKGINNDRAGEVWDIDGLCSDAIITPKDAIQVAATTRITQEEYRKEGFQSYADGNLGSEANQVMESTGYPGMVAYVITPVISANKTLGAIISGTLMSGRTRILENAMSRFGPGFGGMYISDSSKNVVEAAQYGQNSDLSFEFTYSDIASKIPDTFNKVLSNVKSSNNTVRFTQYLNTNGKSFVVAGSRTVPRMYGDLESSIQTNGVLIRGYPLEDFDSKFNYVLSTTMALALVCLILDFMSTMFAISAFVDPLDKMIFFVKLQAYKKYTKVLDNINNSAKFFMRVFLFSLLSTGSLICIAVVNTNQLNAESDLLSSANWGADLGPVVYVTKMAQMSRGSAGISYGSTLQAFALNTSNTVAYSSTVSLLKGEVKRRKIEYATLMDLNATIIASANKDRRGELFDPSGVVSKALKMNKRIYATVEMSYEEFVLEGAPQWFDSASNASLNLSSTLHPYNNPTQPVIVRFAVTPMYLITDIARLKPIAVIAYGDVLNGKVWIPETVTERFNDDFGSYAAVYRYNRSSSQWKLLASAFRQSRDQPYSYDLGLDSTTLLDAALKNSKDQLGDGSVNGVDTQLAITEVQTSFSLDSVYEEHILNGFVGDIFFVRGSKPVYFEAIQKKQIAIHVCNVLIQFISSLAISAMLYRPIRAFTRFLKTQVSLKQHTPADAAQKKMVTRITTDTNNAIKSMWASFTSCFQAGQTKSSTIPASVEVKSTRKESVGAHE